MRKAIAVLVATEHGPLIVNRTDSQLVDGKHWIGVGATLFERSIYGEQELDQLLGLLQVRRQIYGEPVTVIDAGANIGVHSVTLGRMLTGWGRVHAFEPQERIFYMLAGNIALNNLFNVNAYFAALSDRSGSIGVPLIDYSKMSNFGGLNLKPRRSLVDGNSKPLPESDIGQPVDFKKVQPVAAIRIDDLPFPRLDLLKMDVEGMEPEVLKGARLTIERCRPVIFAEQFVCGREALCAAIPSDYVINDLGGYVLALHKDDKTSERINFTSEDAPHNAVPA